MRENGLVEWPQGDDKLETRVYTLRQVRAGSGEIDVDFVLHETGCAADWARDVAQGDIADMPDHGATPRSLIACPPASGPCRRALRRDAPNRS